MQFCDLLSTDSICIDKTAQSKTAVLLKASQILHQNHPELDVDTLFEAYWKRESLGSTAIGYGITIPHVRSDAISKSCAAMLRLQNPVDFAAQDKQPVDLVFALVTPQQPNDHHLQTLTNIIKRFSDASFRSQCRRATDHDALYRLLTDETFFALIQETAEL